MQIIFCTDCSWDRIDCRLLPSQRQHHKVFPLQKCPVRKCIIECVSGVRKMIKCMRIARRRQRRVTLHPQELRWTKTTWKVVGVQQDRVAPKFHARSSWFENVDDSYVSHQALICVSSSQHLSTVLPTLYCNSSKTPLKAIPQPRVSRGCSCFINGCIC